MWLHLPVCNLLRNSWVFLLLGNIAGADFLFLLLDLLGSLRGVGEIRDSLPLFVRLEGCADGREEGIDGVLDSLLQVDRRELEGICMSII